jgi:hypothetical protein
LPARKHELIASEVAALGAQPFQHETMATIEVENIFGLGHLKRITADPGL